WLRPTFSTLADQAYARRNCRRICPQKSVVDGSERIRPARLRADRPTRSCIWAMASRLILNFVNASGSLLFFALRNSNKKSLDFGHEDRRGRARRSCDSACGLIIAAVYLPHNVNRAF